MCSINDSDKKIISLNGLSPHEHDTICFLRFFYFSHLISGLYADLVTRVTNFQNDDKGLMVLASDVFDVPIRKYIIQRVVRWQLAKRQQV